MAGEVITLELWIKKLHLNLLQVPSIGLGIGFGLGTPVGIFYRRLAGTKGYVGFWRR